MIAPNTIAPIIPSQHLSPSYDRSLAKITKRKASLSSLYGNTQSIAEFINTKLDELELDLEYYTTFENGMLDALHHGAITKKEFDDGIRDMSRNSKVPKQREIAILRRQKKRIIENIEDFPSATNDNGLDIKEQAYTHMMVKKIMSCTGNQKKASRFDASKFKTEVLRYYNATRQSTNMVEAYCQLTGWVDKNAVRAAHIVPKALDGHEIGYLFGEGESPSTNPRNALLLLTNLERGMDAGIICFVPEAGQNGSETRWKCLLTDESRRKETYSPALKWGDIDGKYLSFVGSGRPAARYLYFRYITTYIHQKNNGNIAWALGNKSKGGMWPTPGPWIRKSMICVLARAASDYFLPDAVLDEEIKGTFTVSDIAGRPAIEEHDAAISMGMALEADMTTARKGLSGELSEDDEDDEEDDEEEDDDDDDGEDDDDDENHHRHDDDWKEMKGLRVENDDKEMDDTGDEQEANEVQVTILSSSESHIDSD